MRAEVLRCAAFLAARTLVAAATLVVGLGVARAADKPLHFTVLSGLGSKAGEMVVTPVDASLTTVRYSYRDNGRGPDHDERYESVDGVLRRFVVEGTNTYGAKINERFERGGDGLARWTSTSDRGEAKASSETLYLPLQSSPWMSNVALAMLGAGRDTHRTPLLPAGELTQRVIESRRLQASDGGTGSADGHREVALVVQTGVDFTPNYVWATRHQPSDGWRFFAAIVPGAWATVESGFEAHVATLTERQMAVEGELLKGLAKQLRVALPGLTVVRRARVFDSATAKLLEPQDIYLWRGRIRAVVPSGSPMHAEPDNTIDADGRVVLPGLFDMHGHVSRWDGLLNLAAGVTTTRDMGNVNDKLQAIIDETERGDLLGPDIVPTGFLEGASPHASQLGIVIKTKQEALNAVDWYAARGYRQLKIYNSFPKAHLKAVVQHAHRRGMRVSGHIPVFLRAEDAVRAGYDEVQHINQVMLNFLVKPTTDTRTLERFYLPAREAGGIDLRNRRVRDFIKLLKQRHVAVDPTLVTFNFLRQRHGVVAQPFADVADHMPASYRRGLSMAVMEIPDDATAKRFDRSYATMVRLVTAMHRAGVPILAGTDEIAGLSLHAELESYVKAGIPAHEVLQIATRNGARFSALEHDRGRIAAGQRADLVFVEGDPTQDIRALKRTSLVISQGAAYSSKALHEALSIKPFVDRAPIIQRHMKNTTAAPSESGFDSHGVGRGHRH